MSLDIDMEEIAGLFIEESVEGLDVMESGLLNLNLGDADAETMNSIFRAAHSIKGGGATFGFTEISEFAHHVETLLDEMRQGDRQVTRDGVDLLLTSVDCMRDMITSLGSGDVDMTRAKEIEVLLEQALNSEDGSAAAAEVKEPTASAWKIRFKPSPDILRSCNDPIRIFRELQDQSAMYVECLGAEDLRLSAFDPEECQLEWHLTLDGPIERQDVEEAFAWVIDECQLEVEPIAPEPGQETESQVSEAEAQPSPEPEDAGNTTAASGDAPAAPAPAEKKPRAKSAKGSDGGGSIRVNIDKVDALINLVGELVITQSMLSRFQGDFDFTQIQELREGLTQLARNTRELQESVMAVRMLPISFAFSRFPRLVRDTGNALNKKVELRLNGEHTELDKTVLEKIGDPLVHLVRNSLDHGLETPEARAAAGKPETGVLELNAFHEGGNIIIQVIDDGAGINREKVLSKARERGLVGPDEQLSDDRIDNLIFQAGFSTVDQVSDLSGRGVGMDVVRRNITDLGGHVALKSEPGKGSTFTISLPLTLAILDGQLLRVGQESYIVSLVSIVETIQTKAEKVRKVAGKSEMFRLRDEILPVLRLHELLNVPADSTNIEDGLLVIAEANGQRVGHLCRRAAGTTAGGHQES